LLTSFHRAVEEQQRSYEVDRVTRHDLDDRDAALKIYRQELNIHMNRLDDKLDEIIVNQRHDAR
jgi:hypothetical protein